MWAGVQDSDIPSPRRGCNMGRARWQTSPVPSPRFQQRFLSPELQLSLTDTQCYTILNFLLFDLKKLLVWGTCKHKLCIFFGGLLVPVLQTPGSGYHSVVQHTHSHHFHQQPCLSNVWNKQFHTECTYTAHFISDKLFATDPGYQRPCCIARSSFNS